MIEVLKLKNQVEVLAYSMAIAHEEAVRKGELTDELMNKMEARAEEFFAALLSGKVVDFRKQDDISIVEPADLGLDRDGQPLTTKKLVIGDKL